TVFLCVVDPGVGTEREAITVFTTNYTFIGPNNGVLFPAIVCDGVRSIVELKIPNNASNTFHGRDVFAPAAAWIVSGKNPQYRDFKGSLEELKFKQAENEGEIIRIDHFGNAITTINRWTPASMFHVQIGKHLYDFHLRKTYELGEEVPFLIVGSSGTLEISMKGRSAAKHLNLRAGQKILISPINRSDS
ncbi:MAG: S-adenosyl-l-methionine hydroxide adenosyltransferase family protein, partial [Candidatus Hodarchaeota archaeon]